MLRVLTIVFGCLLAHQAAADCAVPSNARQMISEVARMMNAERQRHGLRPLAQSEGLYRAAQSHACDMIQRGYFDHRSPNGATPKVRAERAGVCTRLTAENIAMGWPTAPRVFRGWMESPGHRRNILLDRVNAYGIAVVEPAAGQRGGPRWVMVLARSC